MPRVPNAPKAVAKEWKESGGGSRRANPVRKSGHSIRDPEARPTASIRRGCGEGGGGTLGVEGFDGHHRRRDVVVGAGKRDEGNRGDRWVPDMYSTECEKRDEATRCCTEMLRPPRRERTDL